MKNTKFLQSLLFVLYVTLRSFQSSQISKSNFYRFMMKGSEKFLRELSENFSLSFGKELTFKRWKSGMLGDSTNPSTGVIVDEFDKEYFIKSAGYDSYDMLSAEFDGIHEIYATRSIRVPKPLIQGIFGSTSYIVLEKISFGRDSDSSLFAENLVEMHRHYSPNNMFGWKRNNTIGLTFQPNNYRSSWSNFWDQYRLGYMLQLAKDEGATFSHETTLREKIKQILTNHNCKPSLVHGDLWSGNQGTLRSGEPIIFDPAVYYGDREVDLAMTKLFGRNHDLFYQRYHELWPLPPEWEIREVIYNLYHILNHYILFGGSYLSEANRMIDKILKY